MTFRIIRLPKGSADEGIFHYAALPDEEQIAMPLVVELQFVVSNLLFLLPLSDAVPWFEAAVEYGQVPGTDYQRSETAGWSDFV